MARPGPEQWLERSAVVANRGKATAPRCGITPCRRGRDSAANGTQSLICLLWWMNSFPGARAHESETLSALMSTNVIELVMNAAVWFPTSGLVASYCPKSPDYVPVSRRVHRPNRSHKCLAGVWGVLATGRTGWSSVCAQSEPSGPVQASMELQVVIMEWLGTTAKLAVHLAQVSQVDQLY